MKCNLSQERYENAFFNAKYSHKLLLIIHFPYGNTECARVLCTRILAVVLVEFKGLVTRFSDMSDLRPFSNCFRKRLYLGHSE